MSNTSCSGTHTFILRNICLRLIHIRHSRDISMEKPMSELPPLTSFGRNDSEDIQANPVPAKIEIVIFTRALHSRLFLVFLGMFQ